MIETVLQFVVGGLALTAIVWLELADIVRLLCPTDWEKLWAWLKRAIQVVAVFVATGSFLDPLVSGTATLTVHAPRTVPMTAETLMVETVPVGFLGEAGGDRVRYDGFDARGISQVTVRLRFLETRVKLRIFDRSSPSRSVAAEIVYVSPFVRRGLFAKVVHF